MLAFCDETDLTNEPTTSMVANIHAWVAVNMPSDRYAGLSAQVVAYREDNALPELHGNEIVNPPSNSTWRTVSYDRRVEAYRFACEQVATAADEVRYLHVSQGKYAAMLAEHPDAALPRGYKAAVKRAFKRCIVERMVASAPAIVVFDKDKNNPGPTLEQIDGAVHLEGGGIVRADSNTVAGLQLADVAAYAVGRYIRRRDLIIGQEGNPFDRIGMALVGDLRDRLATLLN